MCLYPRNNDQFFEKNNLMCGFLFFGKMYRLIRKLIDSSEYILNILCGKISINGKWNRRARQKYFFNVLKDAVLTSIKLQCIDS